MCKPILHHWTQGEINRWEAEELARGAWTVRVLPAHVALMRRIARERGAAVVLERQDGPRDAEVWFRARVLRYDDVRREWRVEADSSWAPSEEEAVRRLL
ncbi:hypothetical protein CSW25_07110 [Thermus scotoductus]|uniref:Uncharacterized protein n=2 Tax=Thermaceae TaxID=188786 RepID=A0A430R691_THESC|nr:hypothetical protein phiMa_12 [Thermus phage phiMa]RTG98121.1 hypothetical protein CSW49_01605 [Thermus scotoductus]RTH02831.1 hypothetical protein CSW50_06580 [Thermus scotoductus]RTH06661.1 hypothetical protein CSW45_01485 [Thermus scotoductus]RTH12668.1 hypothetical protein CSW46_01545 [Thermus scotoductus]